MPVECKSIEKLEAETTMNNTEKIVQYFKEKYGIETDAQVSYLCEFLSEKWEEEQLLDPPKQEGECYFCHAPTMDVDLCYGCNMHICSDCIEPFELAPMGPHTIDAHKSTRN